MHLKSFEAHGFKSFADKVNIDFENGITAIVGPNGSGKSNISDAIRWVMGEQSVKYLRGTKMEDVIFSGSSARRAMGMAEVTLVFDNSDHSLPVSFDEVSLRRRVYRSGESEYFINEKSCRLKDVVALLADTGLGRGSMSIIGQNRIDEILNSRPEDRRTIFEEAAGIAKYRLRKKEALRKLDDTAGNLLRLQDIQNELENQLEPMEKAAEKAKVYKTTAYELETLRVTKLSRELDRYEEQQKTLETRMAQYAQEGVELAEKAQAIQLSQNELKTRLEAKEQAYNDGQQTILTSEKQLACYRSDKAVLEERAAQSEARLKQLAKDQEKYRQELARSQETLGLVTDSYDTLEHSLKKVEQKVQRCEAEKTRLTELVQSGDQQLKAYQDSAFESMRNLVSLRNALTTARQEQDRLHRQLELLKQQQEQQQADGEQEQQQLAEAQEQLTALDDRKQELDKKLASATEHWTAAAKTYKENAARQEALRRTSAEKKARLQVLAAMEREHEGYSRGVKTVLNAKAPFRDKVCGVVAELFSTEARYVTAMETALGGAMQDIITEDALCAQQAIAYLKEQQGGRATFLPLPSLRPRPLGNRERTALQEPGILGIAGDLVRADAKLQTAVQFLLGQVLVADTLDHAYKAAKKTDMRVRIVTLDGDIIFAGGSMSGGQKQQSKGFLSRRQEIEGLQAAVQELQQNLQALEAAQKEVTAKGQAYREEREELQGDLQKLAVSRAGLDARVQQLGQTVQNRKESLQVLTLEKRQKLDSFLEQQTKIRELEPELKAKEAEDAQGKQDSIELSKTLTENRQKLDEAGNRYQSAVISYNEIKSQLDALNDRIQTIDNQAEQTEQALSTSEEQTAHTEQVLAESRRKAAELAQQITDGERAMASLETAQQTLQDEKSALQKEQQALAGQQTELDQKKLLLEQKLHKGELEQVKNSGDQEHCRQQLQETYALTPEEAKARSLTDLPAAELARQEKQRAQELAALGTVNLNAEEEYAAAKERYGFLHDQVADMVEAKNKLETVIAGINSDMARRFHQAFNEINAYFSQCYEKLFGGGKARLLIQDEKNILETGIEIQVQPPGKKMRNLALYSGGERALTVIALLFALLTYQPAPFVILDEIDAPLDETNIDRFAQFLKDYGMKTQFIVITHRKGTMEAADVLHGVTMEESGVSRILSVKLAEVPEA